MRTRFSRAEQGQAMVEFSVLMIVLVPLVLYGFYLCDASEYALEIQESVVSTVWDFSNRNKQVPVSQGRGSVDSTTVPATGSGSDGTEVAAVISANRLEYSDHTSAYDDPSDLKGTSSHHHTAIGAHLCYMGHAQNGSSYDDATESSQISCTINPQGNLAWMNLGFSLPAGLSGANPAYAFGESGLNKGGVVTCWAKAWVYNYLIPDTFMPEHSNVDLTNKASKQKQNLTSTIHSDLGVNVFLHDRAAISFDTWAVENAGSFDGTDLLDGSDTSQAGNPFFRRVRDVYYGTGFPFDSNASLSINLFTASYTKASAEMLSLMNKARSNVEYIPVIPLLPANSITGSLPAGLGSLGNLLNELGTVPANPDGVYMASKWKSNGDTATQCSAIDDLACLFGPKYESSPAGNSGANNGNASGAHGARRAYYMGETDPTKDWYPE